MRRVPPVHSPLPPRALAAGLGALLRPDEGLRTRMAARVGERYGARRVLFTDSGTTALALALEGAASVHGGGEAVALPAYGCYDLVTALRGAGLPAVLYDLDPDTLSPDETSLSRALEGGAGVVVVAHLYGIPVDLDAVAALVDGAGATLVEDAAQGAGASYRGRPLGSHGSLSILSFGRGKGLSGGGGGALLAHDEAGEAALAAAGDRAGPAGRGGARLAAAAAQWMLGRPSVYGLPARLPFLDLGETLYRPPHPPRDVPRTCLAVLERSWEPSLREAEGRRRRARRLLRSVESAPGLRPVRPPSVGTPGYLRLPALAEGEAVRVRLSTDRARRLGVMPGYPKPLHRLEAYREGRSHEASDSEPLPGAERLARRLFTLPVHGRLSPDDLSSLETLIAAAG